MLLDNAREVVAHCLSLRPDEVTFTTSGTDAVHRGLLGLAHGRRRHGATVAHSAVEHSSVLHALDWRGGPTVEVPVLRSGALDLAALDTVLDEHADDLAAFALQSANHEVGTRQDLVAAKEHLGDIPLFTDACASWGHSPVPAVWDVAAGSAHKWGGPAGVGLLLVRKGARWRHPFPVDDRGDERASGFDNVPGVLAAAAALQATLTEGEATQRRQHAQIERIRRAVSTMEDVDVVGDPEDRLPHVVTFSCLYLDGESLVTELDRAGFGIASGSACTSSTMTPSHVLAAMGALTHGNVRLSLHRDTTDAQIDAFLAVLPRVVNDLRARIGM